MDGPMVKRRAACDECRTKKLKCTGEHPACSRCIRENISCVYSPQKQMGRPKKRQRAEHDDDGMTQAELAGDNQGEGHYAPFATAAKPRLGLDAHEHGALDDLEQLNLGDMETIYTPGGGLQPWLVDRPRTWADAALEDQHQTEGTSGVPALTPDSSSNSPPLQNLPHDAISTYNGSTVGQTPINHVDGSTALLLNPDVADPNASCFFGSNPSCACLSTMYLTLNSLQSMDEPFTFPFALHPLREAIKTSASIVDCPECPKRFISGIQNTQLLGTVVVSIAERFGKVVQAISSEAKRAELAGESKKFRLADLNTSTSHLHAGGLGCLAAFNLNLSPAEWRSMCKKVVRAEVFGPADGNDCCAHFVGLTKRIEERQDRWHKGPPAADAPKDAHGVPVGPPRNLMTKEDHLCMKLINYANSIVERIDWT